MQSLYCRCEQAVFCDNTLCVNCGRALGFDTLTNTMHSLDPGEDGQWLNAQGVAFRFCKNRLEHSVCNGLVEADSDAVFCGCCSLNRVIPNLSRAENVLRWSRLERAKRRLVSGLSTLGLDLRGIGSKGEMTMQFDFLEDKRSHSSAIEKFVATGHKDGVITINLLEADEVQRVKQRELMGERYRTILGHCRHEAGHFYYQRLVTDRDSFIDLFGDPDISYADAMQAYYDQGPPPHWEASYISSYATSHAWEDWAECFAHYLHIMDTLETAEVRGMVHGVDHGDMASKLQLWREFTLDINEVSRSLGVRDAYPFMIAPAVEEKLAYVDSCVRAAVSPR